MVVIRLSRGGVKKRPFYRIIVADSRYPRDGRFIEKVGFFDPMSKNIKKKIYLDIKRMSYWTSCGANMSKRVYGLFKEFNKVK